MFFYLTQRLNPKFLTMNLFIRISCSLLFILSYSFVSAQISKGFDALKAKDYYKAKSAFESDLNKEVDGTAAKLGLAECYLSMGTTIDDYKTGLKYVRTAREEYSKIKSNDKTKLKKYGVSLNKFSSLDKKLQSAAIDRVKSSKSVIELDTFMAHFEPVHKSLQAKWDETKLFVVKNAVRYAQDYKTLSSLVNNHYVLVAKTNYRYSKDLQSRLFRSFVKEFGVPNLDDFKAQQPDHSFSKDCWVDEFTKAVKDPSLKGLLNFLINYPLSTLDFYASYLLRSKTGNGMFIPGEASLSAREKEQLTILIEEWMMEDQVQYSPELSFEFHERLLELLKKSAPSARSYDLMKKALQKYLITRKFDAATALITKSQPLYPDGQPEGCETRFYFYSTKQPWFKVAIPIVEAPDEGIIKEKVDTVNTEKGDEFSPVVASDGSTMYFAGIELEGAVGGEDIYKSEFDYSTRKWKKPEIVKELSSGGDESPLSMTSDGNNMLVFKDGKLYLSKLTSSGWSTPKLMPENINSFKWIGRATLSADGRIMIFSASEDPEEIYGDSNIDLYVTRKDDRGDWSEPFKLGPDINTFKEERSPYIHSDNRTLYFSSNGHKGLGEMDVYYTKRLDDSWTRWSIPKNMGKEINTLEDDWGYNYSMTPIGNATYLSADEIYSGLGDIYSTGLPEAAKPEEIMPIRGKVSSNDETKIVITDAETGEVIDEVETRPDGSFTLLAPKNSVITYHPKDEDLFPVSKTVDVSKLDPFDPVDTLETIKIEDMLKKGVAAPLNNILFDFDKDILKEQSFPELQRVLEIIRDKNWLISIEGHTDNEGTPAYNKDLSYRRAGAVRNYFAEKGVNMDRMSIEGFGDSVPVTTNETEEGRALNRRVEIRFIEASN